MSTRRAETPVHESPTPQAVKIGKVSKHPRALEETPQLAELKELLEKGLREAISRELVGEGMRRLLREELARISSSPPKWSSSTAAEIGESKGRCEGLSLSTPLATPPKAKDWGDLVEASREEGEGREEHEDESSMHLNWMAKNKMRLGTYARTIGEDQPQMDTRVLLYQESLHALGSHRWRDMVQVLHEWHEWIGTEEAPDQHTPIRRLLDSLSFNMAMGLVIVLNVLFVVIDTNRKLEGQPIDALTAFSIDLVFFAFYLIEFILKISHFRWYFFVDVHFKTNIFDMLLLIGQSANVLTTITTSGQAHHQDVGWLRFLRLVRMTRILRVIKFAANVGTLYSLLVCLSETILSTLWAFVLLLGIYFVFALAICMGLAGDFDANNAEMTSSFGSVQLGMLSLVQSTTGGRDWGEVYELLSYDAWGLERWVFLGAVMFMQIAVMNIILGVFVDKAMQSLRMDQVEKAQESFREERRTEDHLRKLCSEVESNSSGKMSSHDWKLACGKAPMREYVYMLGLPEQHLAAFIDMLADGPGGEVTIDDFVRGCMRLRGTASCFDMNSVLYELLSMQEILLNQFRALRACQKHR